MVCGGCKFTTTMRTMENNNVLQLRTTTYKLQNTNYKMQTTKCKLQTTNYNPHTILIQQNNKYNLWWMQIHNNNVDDGK